MVDEGMAFVACTGLTVVPDDGRHSVRLCQLSIIFQIVLLESLLTGSGPVDAAELTEVYRYPLGNKVHIYLLEHLLQVGLIVTGSLF